MKRFWKSRETCLALLVMIGLALISNTGFAQSDSTKPVQKDLRYITSQYKTIANDYLPGTTYEQTINDLYQRIEAMNADESSQAAQILKPLMPTMLVNLQMFKEALSGMNKVQRSSSLVLSSDGFPNAEYPNMQLSNYPSMAIPAFFDVLGILDTALSLLSTGSVTQDQWTSSWVNAAPLTCVTRLDDNGVPIRTPDFTLQTLRTLVQIAEATKEGANCVLEQVLEAATFGANLKWLTIVPTMSWLIQKAVYENMTNCENMISGAEATASYQRLGHLHTDLDTLSSKTDAAQGDLSEIKSALDIIETKLDQAIQLLQTPQGLRPDFPVKNK